MNDKKWQFNHDSKHIVDSSDLLEQNIICMLAGDEETRKENGAIIIKAFELKERNAELLAALKGIIFAVEEEKDTDRIAPAINKAKQAVANN